MQRRDEIRAAMHNLLTATKRPESAAAPINPLPIAIPSSAPPAGNPLVLAEPQMLFLRDIQNVLQENGIEADQSEIVHAIMVALSDRPNLCRGLLAAYLLEG